MKKFLKGFAWLLAAIIILAIAYLGYVFLSFNRIADNQSLEIENNASGALQQNAEYTALSWNVGFGAYSDDYSFFMDGGAHARAFSKEAVVENISTMTARIQEIDPDLALLQEVDFDSDKSWHVDQRALFEASFSDQSAAFAVNYDSAYLFYPFHQPIGQSRSGILTLARAEIESAQRRSLPIETGVAKFLDLDRCYSVSRIPVENGKMLYLYNLHLSAYTTDGNIATEQLQMLLDDMNTTYIEGNYALAAGDFNKDLLGDSSSIFGVSAEGYTWAQPFPSTIVPEGLVLYAPEGSPSCRNADRPYIPGETFVLTVDGFLASKNIDVVSAQVLDEAFACSDHNPVILKFQLLDA